MDEGMALGMLEVEKGTAGLRQVLVLTDGETSGEQNCRALATKAAEKKVHLTLMGIGLDWKASLIKDLAEKSAGKWYYIDTNEKMEAQRIFAEEFEQLAATAFTDVEIHLRPMKDIKVKRLRQVAPEIKELKTTEPEERHMVAPIGSLQHDSTSRFIIDMSLPKRPDGKYVIAQLQVTYDIGAGKRETTGMVPLEMSYTEKGHGYVNAEVMKHIDEIQLKEMSDNLQKALASQDQEKAKEVAQQMEKKGELMGKRPTRRRCWPSKCCKSSTPAAACPRKPSWPWMTPPVWLRTFRPAPSEIAVRRAGPGPRQGTVWRSGAGRPRPGLRPRRPLSLKIAPSGGHC